jgi:HAD superfamily hydrolase (TIGR01509 family)
MPNRRPRNPLASFSPKAVLFDFDGVLVNSEPLHFRALQATLADEHLPLSEHEYYDELIGFDDRGAFHHIFAKHNRLIDPKTLLRLMTAKSQRMRDVIHAHHYAPLPGVYEVVRALWRHYPLAIVTGALREEVEAMLEGIALRDCFPIITAAEDVTLGKPDPQGYLLTAQAISQRYNLPLTPADCLVIEDAPQVLQTTKAAGFKTLGVASSHLQSQLHHAHQSLPSLTLQHLTQALPKLQLNA